MKRGQFDVQTTVAGVTLGAVCAVTLFLILGALSRPQDFNARAVTLDQTLSRAERLSTSHANPYAYAGGTICDSPGSGADDLKRRTEAAAAGASVALSTLAINPPVPGSATGQVAPVTLQLTASGKYEAVVTMLGMLANAEPQVFVDTADLKPASGGAVNLKLTGKVLCWTSARH